MLCSISNLYNELEQRFKDFLDESRDSRCLLDLLKIPATSVLTSVVQYLLKFHEDDDNVFSINGQVLCISLEDVHYITGLPIQGKPIINDKNRDLHDFDRVFGIKKTVLSIDELSAIARDTTQTYDRRKTAVLLIVVRSFIVPDSSGARVYTTFLRFIEDFEQVDKYAWGSALLAFLFCGMSRKAIKNKKTIHGNSWLILAFFILRIPKLQKELGIELNEELSVPILSTIVEQVKKIANNRRTDYQERLNHIFPDLSHDDVDWTPYKSLHKDPARYREQQLVATYVGAIICNNYVAYHKPHLAAEQFPVLEDLDLQNLRWQAKVIKLKQNKGDSEQHLLTDYQDHIKEWNERLLLKDHLQENHSSPSAVHLQQNNPSPPPSAQFSVQLSSQPLSSPQGLNQTPHSPQRFIQSPPSPHPISSLQRSPQLLEHGEGEINKKMNDTRILQCLEPGKHIDERVIDYYVSYINRTRPSESLLLLNSYVYSKLENHVKEVSAHNNVNNDESIKMGWFKGGFDKYSYIIFPICFECHYSLVIVCFMEASISILHLDSLGLHPSDEIFRVIVWTLKEQWKRERAASKFPDTVTETVDVPQQPNAYDCAFFVIHMIKLFLQQAPPRFEIDNLKMFGRMWFDPLDACALRERIKPVIADELKRSGFEADIPVPWNVSVPQEKKTMGNHLRKRERKRKETEGFKHKEFTQPETTMDKKLRSNIKTVGGHVRKREEIDYGRLCPDQPKNVVYGENLVHRRIKVWWPDDEKYYNGVIASFNARNKQHQVKYDDGDKEFLILKKERWDFLLNETNET